eukprot:UN28080
MYYDRDTPYNGGRKRSKFLLSNPILKLIRDYFPITTIVDKGAKFNKTKRYLFALHPHGVIGVSHVNNFVNLIYFLSISS